MIEIIRSQEMKDYLHSIRYFLSDSAKATLVYNSLDHTREEILKSLEELAENTEDDQVKQQIMERLTYEKMVMDTFCTNESEKFVYVVVDNDGEIWGHFIDAHVALDYAVELSKKERGCFRIEKHLVVQGRDIPMQKNPIRCNSEIGIGKTDDFVSFAGYPDGILKLKDGNVIDVWSNEIPREQELDEFAPKRFENAFVSIPFPAYFSKGHPVRHVLNGQYGVIGTSHEEWNEFVHRIDAGLLKVDYVDMSLTVFFLADDGHYFSHEHINPIFLETATPDDHMAFRAIDALCTYLTNETPDEEQSVLRACRDYAESKRRKSLIETAITVNDILI